MSVLRVTLAGVVVLLAAPAARPADAAVVRAAVQKGADYLRGQRWGMAGQANDAGGGHGIGPAGLSGLALLEAGTKADDPAVVAIAGQIRDKAPAETGTYQISLAILFLDRLGDARDEVLIQRLGTRLYGGMMATGSYSYQCADLVPAVTSGPAAADAALTTAPLPAPDKPKVDDGFPRAKPKAPGAAAADPNPGKLDPGVVGYNTAVRQVVRYKGRPSGEGDNSNTQFGLIGLWVAARHGVPADDAFALLEARFLTTQNPANGGWAYIDRNESTPAMTCAGLLGLAVGASRRPAPALAPAQTAPPPGAPADPFDAPPAGGKAADPKKVTPQRMAVAAGLTALGRVVRGVPVGQLGKLVGAGDEYYTLWSIERVAMAYGLDTLGDADWHAWGCNWLLPKQQADGSWQGTYQADVSTAFAMLFLLKANLVGDLTARLKGKVKDPGKTEMRAGVIGGPTPPAGGAPADPAADPAEPPAPPADPAKLAADLAAATTDFTGRLNVVRDAKGAEHTAALVLVIPRLTDPRQTQARDALADRLVRMTPKTLKAMLAEPDAELRVAACQAIGQKDAKTLVGDLIDRVADGSEPVSQAARANLKRLTNQDHGPPANADAAAKAAAKAAWAKWYLAAGGAGK